MTNKVLLSMLAAAAAPAGAFASVDVTALIQQKDWTMTGVDGQANAIISGNDLIKAGVTTTSAKAQLKVTLEALPVGEYTLVLENSDNLAINGVKVNENGEYTFTVAEAGDVEFTLASADQMHGFKVKVDNLKVNLDKFTADDTLQTIYDLLTESATEGYQHAAKCNDQDDPATEADDTSAKAKELNTEAADYNKKLTDLAIAVAELQTAYGAADLAAFQKEYDDAKVVYDEAKAKADDALAVKNAADAAVAAAEKDKTTADNAATAAATALAEANNKLTTANAALANATRTEIETNAALTSATTTLRNANAALETVKWTKGTLLGGLYNAAKTAADNAQAAYESAKSAHENAVTAKSEAEAAQQAADSTASAAAIAKGNADQAARDAATALGDAEYDAETAQTALGDAKKQLDEVTPAKESAERALQYVIDNQDDLEANVVDAWKKYNSQAGLGLLAKNDAGKTLVDVHNDNVDTENARYAQEKQNAGNLATCNSVLNQAQNDLDAINKAALDIMKRELLAASIMEEQAGYPQSVIAEDAAALQAAITAAKAQAKTVYDNDQKPAAADVEALEEAINAIAIYDNPALNLLSLNPADYTSSASGTQVRDLADALAEAVADAEAYTTVQKNRESLKKIYDNYTHDLQPITNGTAARYMDELQAFYDEAEAKLAARDTVDAHEKAVADQKVYDDAVYKMGKVIDRLNARLDANNKAKAELDKALVDAEDAANDGTLVKQIDELQGKINNIKDEANNTLLQGKLNEIKNDVNALRNTVNEEYGKYALTYDDNNTPADLTDDSWSHKTEVEALATKLNGLGTTIGNAADHDGNLADIAQYKDDLEAAKKAIKDALVNTSDNVTKDAVAAAFDAAYESIKTAIDTYNQRVLDNMDAETLKSTGGLNQDEKDKLTQDIADYKAKGVEAAAAFSTHIGDYNTLVTKTNDLYDHIKPWGDVENGRYKHAIAYTTYNEDGTDNDYTRKLAEAQSYKDVTALYLPAIEKVLADHAENDAEALNNAILALSTDDVKGNVKVDNVEAEKTITQLLDTDYVENEHTFAAKVTEANLATLSNYSNSVNSALTPKDATVAKYGPALDTLKTKYNYWEKERVFHTWSGNDRKVDVKGVQWQNEPGSGNNEYKGLFTELRAKSSAVSHDSALEMFTLSAPTVSGYYEMKAWFENNMAVAEENVVNYNALKANEANLYAAQTNAVAAAKTEIEDICRTSAQKHYKDELDKLVAADAAPKDLADIIKKYTDEYNHISKGSGEGTKWNKWLPNTDKAKDGDGVNDAEKTAYELSLTNVQTELEKAIKAIVDDAKANEAAHDNLLTLEQETVTDINENYDYVKKNYDKDVVVGQDEEGNDITVQDILDAIKALKLTVSDINNEVRESYDKGENDEDEATLTQKYKDVQAAVDELVKAVEDEYLNSVKAQNKADIAAIWGPMLDDLYEAFRHGVNTYEVYKSANENEDYHNTLMEALGGDHAQAIYDYAAPIAQLRAQVAQLEKSLWAGAEGNIIVSEDGTPNPAIFDEGMLTDIMRTATSMLEGMKAYTENIETTAQDTAEDYYAGKKAAAKAVLAAANTEMTNVGISQAIRDEYLAADGAQGIINQAEFLKKLYSAENTPEVGEEGQTTVVDVNKPVLSLYMDGIIEILASVSVDMEGAAAKHWATELQKVNDAIALLKTDMETYNASGVTLDEENLLIADANALLAYIVTYAEQSQADGNFMGDVKFCVESINTALGYYQNAHQSAIDKYNNYQENLGDKANYLEDLADLKDAYKALEDAVKVLDLTLEQFQGINTPAIGEEIEKLENSLNNYELEADAADNQAKYDKMFADIETLITEAYDKAYEAQVENLGDEEAGLIHDVQYAYDIAWKDAIREETLANGKVSDETVAKYEALNSDIEAAKTKIADAIAALDASDKADADYQDALTALHEAEEALEDAMKTLNPEYVDNDGQTKKNDMPEHLQGIYDEVSFAAAETALTDAVDVEAAELAGYQQELADLEAELAGVKTAWEADNQLVLTYRKYEKQMAEIQEKADDLAEKVNNAQAEAYKAKVLAAENARYYQKLQDVITDLKDLVESAETLIGVNTLATIENYQERIDDINGWITADEDWLDENKDALVSYELARSFAYKTLPYVTTVEDAVEALKTKVVADEVAAQKAAANKAIADVKKQYNELKAAGYVFADKAGIDEAIDDLDTHNTSLQGLQASYQTLANDDFGSIQSESADIVETAEDLLKTIKENSVLPADMNYDDEITIADYNKLLRIILNDEDDYDATLKSCMAADVTGNGEINMGDVTALINILTRKPAVAQLRAAARLHAEGENSLSMAFVGEQNGVRRLAISLDNAVAFNGTQFDVVLPEGLKVVDAVAGDRMNGMNLYTNDLGDGRFRVIFSTTKLITVGAGEGAMLYLDIEGSASSDITITEAIASDANAATYKLNVEGAVATGINSVTDEVIAGVKKVYNMGGQLLDSMKKGVNILVGNDNKGKKVLKK